MNNIKNKKRSYPKREGKNLRVFTLLLSNFNEILNLRLIYAYQGSSPNAGISYTIIRNPNKATT
jgi:hypothetical protein